MRKPLKIGPLTFEYPFVLAPLAGITDKSMRSLCCQAGASLTYTEMVSAKGLWYGDRKTGELLAVGEEEGPVGFQLFGSEPEILGYAVRLLSDPAHAKAVDAEMAEWFEAASAEKSGHTAAGAIDSFDPAAVIRPPHIAANRAPMGARTAAGLRPPALFDLNAGCPVPKIVRNGEGSALLKDPELFYDCVSAMCDASKRAAADRAADNSEAAGADSRAAGDDSRAAGAQNCAAPKVPEAAAAQTAGATPVTVKIRKGFERDEDCAVEIAKAAEAAGAAAVTVHGRTQQQFYDCRFSRSVVSYKGIGFSPFQLHVQVFKNRNILVGKAYIAEFNRLNLAAGICTVIILRNFFFILKERFKIFNKKSVLKAFCNRICKAN